MPGQVATFVNSNVTGPALTQPVQIDSTYTVGEIDFTSGTNFTLESYRSGAGYSLTLDNKGAGVQINLTNSYSSLITSLILADSSGTTTFNIDPQSYLYVSSFNGSDNAISGSGQAIVLNGGGEMELASPNGYSGGTTVMGGSAAGRRRRDHRRRRAEDHRPGLRARRSMPPRPTTLRSAARWSSMPAAR